MEPVSTKPRALAAAGIALVAGTIAGVASGDGLFQLILPNVVYHVVRILVRRFAFGLSRGFGVGAVFLGPLYDLLLEKEYDRQIWVDGEPQPPGPSDRRVLAVVAGAFLVAALIFAFNSARSRLPSCSDPTVKDMVMQLFEENTGYRPMLLGSFEEQGTLVGRACEARLVDTDRDRWDVTYMLTEEGDDVMLRLQAITPQP